MAENHVRFGDRKVALPKSRIARVAIGAVLVAGGIVGFLPVVGFWMIPLGLIVLSVDLPIVRRWRRQAVVAWGRRFPRAKAATKTEDY